MRPSRERWITPAMRRPGFLSRTRRGLALEAPRGCEVATRAQRRSGDIDQAPMQVSAVSVRCWMKPSRAT